MKTNEQYCDLLGVPSQTKMTEQASLSSAPKGLIKPRNFSIEFPQQFEESKYELRLAGGIPGTKTKMRIRLKCPSLEAKMNLKKIRNDRREIVEDVLWSKTGTQSIQIDLSTLYHYSWASRTDSPSEYCVILMVEVKCQGSDWGLIGSSTEFKVEVYKAKMNNSASNASAENLECNEVLDMYAHHTSIQSLT